LESVQLALKILANATSYGIFVEINVEQLDDSETVSCFGAGNSPFSVQTKNLEKPGPHFHPLLERVLSDWNREPCGTGLMCDS
ncbi:MAG: hypothetical protein P4L96_18600, partial [Rhodoferax sp.]|nr:hypothetical protein [Rhodoferax sp.]